MATIASPARRLSSPLLAGLLLFGMFFVAVEVADAQTSAKSGTGTKQGGAAAAPAQRLGRNPVKPPRPGTSRAKLVVNRYAGRSNFVVSAAPIEGKPPADPSVGS